jgi:hypothetical protein
MPCKGLEESEVGFVYLFALTHCITLDLSKPGWDTCADMSQLSTRRLSGLRCLCSKRDRRRLAPTLADRPH